MLLLQILPLAATAKKTTIIVGILNYYADSDYYHAYYYCYY